jgi:hypothetical protein
VPQLVEAGKAAACESCVHGKPRDLILRQFTNLPSVSSRITPIQ